MDDRIQLRFLDHVAITVSDLERSAKWYESVLNLKRYELKAWGKFPIFMLAGKSGVALFPTKGSPNPVPEIRIHHFAFNVDQVNFKKARKHYEQLQIDYDFQDHHYFHSIYTKDPDGHQVELTTLVAPEADFYQ
ncbi:MAG: VOC family protein [Bacteroidota bacterium]